MISDCSAVINDKSHHALIFLFPFLPAIFFFLNLIKSWPISYHRFGLLYHMVAINPGRWSLSRHVKPTSTTSYLDSWEAFSLLPLKEHLHQDSNWPSLGILVPLLCHSGALRVDHYPATKPILFYFLFVTLNVYFKKSVACVSKSC